jgi:cysteine desulfurase
MPVYLDNSATTKVRQEVVDAMLPYVNGLWGNASSIHHYGRESHKAVDIARAQVAKFLNCASEEILFTPCSTYSNNTAILGRARFAEANGQGRHLITSLVEHPSVMGPAKYLEGLGWQVTYLPVDRQGFVNAEDLKRAITSDTSIISIIWANNEIGTIQPIEELAAIANERGIYFHTDAVQVAGKVAIDLAKLPVSALALSGHKFYAPKGIGILFLRKNVNLMPIVFGGGQEKGLFPGTENLPFIVGIGKAAELCGQELPASVKKLRKLQAILTEKILSVPGVKMTGPLDAEKRLPGHVSVVVPGAQGEALVLRSDLQGVCISSGSACHSGVIEPSQILKAIRLPREEALGAVRISASAFTTFEECEKAASTLAEVFTSLIEQAKTTAQV